MWVWATTHRHVELTYWLFEWLLQMNHIQANLDSLAGGGASSIATNKLLNGYLCTHTHIRIYIRYVSVLCTGNNCINLFSFLTQYRTYIHMHMYVTQNVWCTHGRVRLSVYVVLNYSHLLETAHIKNGELAICDPWR